MHRPTLLSASSIGFRKFRLLAQTGWPTRACCNRWQTTRAVHPRWTSALWNPRDVGHGKRPKRAARPGRRRPTPLRPTNAAANETPTKIGPPTRLAYATPSWPRANNYTQHWDGYCARALETAVQMPPAQTGAETLPTLAVHAPARALRSRLEDSALQMAWYHVSADVNNTSSLTTPRGGRWIVDRIERTRTSHAESHWARASFVGPAGA